MSIDIFIPELLSERLQEAYAQEREREANDITFSHIGDILAGAGAFILLFATPFLIYGQYAIRSWARKLTTYVTAVAFIAMPFWGPSLNSGLADVLFFISALTWGMLITIMYFTPFAKHFN